MVNVVMSKVELIPARLLLIAGSLPWASDNTEPAP